jgi:hypothetical protein
MAGCNVDAIDNLGGKTALMYAVNFGHLKCVWTLQLTTTGVDTGVVAFNEEKGVNMRTTDFVQDDTADADEICRLLGRACVHCSRMKKNMFKCGACTSVSVYYCAHECQRTHWPEHTLKCEADTRLTTAAAKNDGTANASVTLELTTSDSSRHQAPATAPASCSTQYVTYVVAVI